jgi:hypothetical protein
MSRGLAKNIGICAFNWGGPENYAAIIRERVKAETSGCARQSTADRALLWAVEYELPGQAAAYYARQKPYIPSAIDDQLAEIRQGWRDDVKAITGKEVIPAGYARVISSNGASGQIRKIHCDCDRPEFKATPFSPFDIMAYFISGETGHGHTTGVCPKCGGFEWYTIKEDCHV